ncbi:MAG: sigma-54 dependent transcriptional regulator [Calditerrivibrio sp.]|nr:sigma-54 dependent transcriptional regulator [Calditerrivibrio sp.]
MKANILIIDDDKALCYSLTRVLSIDYNVITANNSSEAFELLEKNNFSMILIDYKLGEENGIDILKKIKSDYNIPAVMMTAYGTNSTLIDAIKSGAEDFIFKPVEAHDLKNIISKYINPSINICDKRSTKIPASFVEEAFIGISKPIKDLLKLVANVSTTDSPVLITGESGTGKELVANLIQSNSQRSSRPYVVINCAAIPFELLESELFGYEKGAFSGAFKSKPGKFEMADTGTIFLDEIGDLPYKLQSKLLRVLQDGIVEKLGSVASKKVDVRIIAATNRDLNSLVSDNKFRLDLFYRLNVINIHIPPLRERKEDISHLSYFFINKYSKEFKKNITCIENSVLEKLENYSWAGNVRELQNVIKKAVILAKNNCISDESIHFLNSDKKSEFREDIVDWIFKNFPSETYTKFNEYIEEELIKKSLEIHQNNRSRTAEQLGISRVTLNDKLKKYNIVNDTH